VEPLAGSDPWFVLTVKPRHEKAVASHLAVLNLEAYLPLYRSLRRWSDRKKIVEACLFPGYVFCRFDRRDRLAVLNLPSVTSLVSFGDAPAPVPDTEIDAVRTVLASRRPAGPWPFLESGQRVRIRSGAMEGLEGLLVNQENCWRVVVSISLLQRSVAVEIDRDMVEPVRTTRAARSQTAG
jgi:transcription antitermination factor NusG